MLLNAIGWTLIHFLWQGAIITLIFAVADTLSRRASAKVRYAIAAMSMLMMLACAATTFLRLTEGGTASGQMGVVMTPPSLTSVPVVGLAAPRESPDWNYLPWLVYLWTAGVSILSLRLLGQWVLLERCRRQGIRLMDGAWQDRVRRIASRLQLRRAVRLYESAVADVPAAIGWIRPIILVPASALMQLSPVQLEALLAHELAHVRRHDYLINLLQTCVETLFFYHPGVWWIGHRMRDERENCCDDLAVAVCGDPIIYARALADLEQMRSNVPTLAMAANGGSLLSRIRRLIGPREAARPIAPVGIIALTVVAAAAFAWAAPQAQHPQSTPSPEPTPVTIAQAAAPAAKPQSPKPSSSKSGSNSGPAKSEESYLDQLERAGFRNLPVDQMIAMKIHGVTPEYVAEIKSLGWTVTPDQLVSFRIHGVNSETVKELRALGYPLTPDQAVSAKIHGVTPEFANGWKQEGLTGIDFDNLIALKIHGAAPAQLGELKALGFDKLAAGDIVRLRVMGVTPDFIRSVRARGFRDLRLDQIIQLKQLGILDSKESK